MAQTLIGTTRCGWALGLVSAGAGLSPLSTPRWRWTHQSSPKRSSGLGLDIMLTTTDLVWWIARSTPSGISQQLFISSIPHVEEGRYDAIGKPIGM
jgi:hypothetical protein